MPYQEKLQIISGINENARIVLVGAQTLSNGDRIEEKDKTVCFLTDTEHPHGIDERVIELCKDADVVIHDSQYFPDEIPSHKYWGHSSFEQAVEVKQKAGAKNLYLFHHDPVRSDKELYRMLEEAKRLDSDVYLAQEKRDFIKV